MFSLLLFSVRHIFESLIPSFYRLSALAFERMILDRVILPILNLTQSFRLDRSMTMNLRFVFRYFDFRKEIFLFTYTTHPFAETDIARTHA